jgi:Phage tail assembly chaperone protein
MSKIFTVNDVQQVTLIRNMMAVDAVWCSILFKGGVTPVKFYASPTEGNAFSQEMYTRLKAGEFGEIIDGSGEFYTTLPKTQEILEQEALDLRTKLLVESDFSDLPVTQARLSDAQKTAWATYRQALRDITLQQAYPWNVSWPVKP